MLPESPEATLLLIDEKIKELQSERATVMRYIAVLKKHSQNGNVQLPSVNGSSIHPIIKSKAKTKTRTDITALAVKFIRDQPRFISMSEVANHFQPSFPHLTIKQLKLRLANILSKAKKRNHKIGSYSPSGHTQDTLWGRLEDLGEDGKPKEKSLIDQLMG